MDLIPFEFDRWPVRAILENDVPWFVAKDIAAALGYSVDSNASRLFASVPEEWKGVKRLHTPGGEQSLLCISEQGLYFFLGRSDKPLALPFQKWLAGEVVPSIRRSGSFGAVIPTRTEALRMALEASERADAAEARIVELEPKAAFADEVAGSKGWQKIQEVGSTLKIKNIFPLLNRLKWIFRDSRGHWVPYKDKIDSGWMMKSVHVRTDDNTGEKISYPVSLISPRGMVNLKRALGIDETGVQK